MIWWRRSTDRWEDLHPGVFRLAGTPPTWRQALLAACLSIGVTAVVSHRAAGALWRFAGVEPGMIEISVPRGRRVRRRGVVFHEVVLPAVDVSVVDAIPVTTPTRTLIDLAAVIPRETVEEALDDALRRGLTSLSRLRWRLGELARSGRLGVAIVRALIEQRLAAVPQSVLETRLLRMIKRAGLPAPRCQHEIKDRGRLIAIVDFAYPDVRLAIEADGYRWHSGRVRWEQDLARRNALTARGWRVIHLTATDLERRPQEVVGTIAAALSRTATRSRRHTST